MGDVFRICPECSADIPLQARHCPTCGSDSQANQPIRQLRLPATVSGALLPVAAGLAGLALRAGWKLLQSQWLRTTVQNALTTPPPAPTSPTPTATTGRTIRIRSSWVVREADGSVRQGQEDHTINLE